MRYRLSLLCAVAPLCTVAATLVTINADDALKKSEPQSVPAIPAKSDAGKADQMTVCVYPVSDLPVWRYKASIKTKTDEKGLVVPLQDRPSGQPDFDATLLISNLKSSMGEEAAKDTTIAPHETTASLVIRTTRMNHERIAELLETLRVADRLAEKRKRWQEEKQKLIRKSGETDNLLEKWQTVPASERANRTEDFPKLEQPVVDQSTSQAKEYDHQLLLVVDAMFKSERLATTNVEAATKAIKAAHQTLQKSTLARPLKSRLEDRLDQHQQGLERRYSFYRTRYTREFGGLFDAEIGGVTILPSQPKPRPLTSPSMIQRNQPLGIDSWTKDELFQTHPSQLYLDQESLAEDFTGR